jgi:kynureninase
MDSLASKWRSEFPILAKKTYLINNSLGAMPRRTYDRLKEYADVWAEQGVLAWDRWLPMVTETGDLVGRLFNAPKGSVMMHQNVSTLTAIVISALEFGGKRRKVVTDSLNFPTVHYNWERARALGAELQVVESDDGIETPLERVLEAIDERTLAVPVSHVQFRSSALQDAAAIVERAHKVGAYVVLDTYQSTGTVPFDVQALGVDFVVGGSVKWLCGGAGAGYLYVRPDLQKTFEPRMCGWFSHKRPFAFELGPIEYADDIHRFMGGSPSVPALYSARSGYEVIAEVGVPAIREKSQRQTQRMLEKALAAGLTVNSPRDPRRRGGTLCVDFEGSRAAHDELIRRNFFIDWRPRCGIRISPHFYNTDEECDAILEEIARIRKA